jgi:uncharacterized coiled-coil DUF342 family protein
MDFVKITDHNSLVRDMTSGAIINTDTQEYINYVKRVEKQTKLNEQINNNSEDIKYLKDEIINIKTDLSDIKTMLTSLIVKGK